MAVLYKFRAMDINALRVLLTRQVYFAAPATLNDPLDSQLPILKTVDGIIGQMVGEDAEIMTKIRNMTVTHRASGDVILLHDSFEQFIRDAGIFSLSRTATDTLLWSHYAAAHTGFCIGFEKAYFDDLLKRAAEIHLLGAANVIYADSHVPALTDLLREMIHRVKGARHLQENPEEAVITKFKEDYRLFIIVQFLTMKSAAWKYEQEFRAIMLRPGAVDFPASAISEIVFGLRTSKLDEATVRGTLSGPEWKHVRFRRTQTRWDSFALDLVDC